MNDPFGRTHKIHVMPFFLYLFISIHPEAICMILFTFPKWLLCTCVYDISQFESDSSKTKRTLIFKWDRVNDSKKEWKNKCEHTPVHYWIFDVFFYLQFDFGRQILLQQFNDTKIKSNLFLHFPCLFFLQKFVEILCPSLLCAIGWFEI